MLRWDYASDIEFVEIPSAINLDSSWRSMAKEDCRKTTRFPCPFASVISQTSDKHIWRPVQSLGYTKIRLLLPFPCIGCIFSSSNDIIGNMGCRRSKSSTDLREVFSYPPNCQDLHENRITFCHCPVSYHI